MDQTIAAEASHGDINTPCIPRGRHTMTTEEYLRKAALPADCISYGGVQISIQYVTPQVANHFLEKNDANRRIRQPVVRQYARDMQAGEWLFKPLAICFDNEGRLGNGQHTLSAIVESGRPQFLLVADNVPREVIAKMDRGVQRSNADVAHFLGASFDIRQSSVARIIGFGPTDIDPRSYDELFNAYMEHQRVIDGVCAVAPRTAKGFSAPVLATCARALYTQDQDRVMRFLEILRTGVAVGPHESAAIKLRDFCNSHSHAGSKARVVLYRKAQSCLQSFLAGRPMAKVYGTPVELFPLPKAQ